MRCDRRLTQHASVEVKGITGFGSDKDDSVNKAISSPSLPGLSENIHWKA
jgi:hypothetical protein